MSRVGLFLFCVTIFLAIFGVFILYETSTYNAMLQLGDKYFFVKYQLMWVVLGTVVSLIISRFNYKALYKLSLPLLVGTLILLVLVFFPGIGLQLKGANRWIHLGFFVIQPSELLKISLTLYLAAWLSKQEKERLGPFLLLFSTCIALVIIQPDMGTSMIIAGTSLIVYFLSGAAIREMAIIILLFIVGVFILIGIAPYRMARLTAFQNVSVQNIDKTSYHVKQILISLGSGGLTGLGFGNSIQKYAYLPESTTDSVFSVYAEESGFIGSTFLVFIYFIQLVLGFIISARSPDKFGSLLAAGIITFIAIQAFVNLGSQVILIPLTGVPLPFISYGGSSMIINFVSIGILLSISRDIRIQRKGV